MLLFHIISRNSIVKNNKISRKQHNLPQMIIKVRNKIFKSLINMFIQGWEPPFCVDVEHFKFTPRVQQLNELEVCVNHNIKKKSKKLLIKINISYFHRPKLASD